MVLLTDRTYAKTTYIKESSMLRACTLLALFLCISVIDAQDKYDARLPLGKWEPDNAPPGLKATIEFQKDNKIEISVDFQGKQQKTEGTYKLEGESLTFKFTRDGKDRQQKGKVIKLNNRELIIKDDEKGEEQVLKKIP